MQKVMQKQMRFISWILFLTTFALVLISTITVIFPAFLLRTLGGFEDHLGVNPFETGIWAYPILATNFILLGLGILYFKNRLPQIIKKSIRFIFNFEVSPQVAFLVVIVLIGIYITFNVSALFNGKYDPDYYVRVKSFIVDYSKGNFPEGLQYNAAILLEAISVKVFANDKIIPFITSISMLVLTYFTTAEITKKRFAGIISLLIVFQSNVFLMYNTSVAYPNFWILFYLLSLYLISKKWPLSPISYVASVLSKGLTAIFLPMTLFFIYRSDIPKQKKRNLLISYGIIAILGIVFFIFVNPNIQPEAWKNFSFHSFVGDFSAFNTSLRFDEVVVLFFLPLTVGLFIASRRGVVHADSIMFLIVGMLISGPFMTAISDLTNQPYRFVLLVVFFAIGVGILFSKKINEQP